MRTLPKPDYVLSDFEEILGLPTNTALKAIKAGRLGAYRKNGNGAWRIPYASAISYAKTCRTAEKTGKTTN